MTHVIAWLRPVVVIFLAIALAFGTTGFARADEDDDDDGGTAPSGTILDNDEDPSTDGYRSDQAIVRLAAGADIAAFNARHQTSVLRSIPAQDTFLLQLLAAVDEPTFEVVLEDDPDTDWAELNSPTRRLRAGPATSSSARRSCPGRPATTTRRP